MSVETIEGEVIDVTPAEIRAVAVVQQPGQALVNEADTPLRMVGVATALADALKDIVERQKLYAVIQGKKYPQVEAWMTIARLDNVVAREPQAPIRHDDGSYEAFAELIRLSDGMVIGASSALCGTPDDKPWATRSEPARRSMAQTRATSRAFRQQYSWIMALAGYEPTPAEEMPADTSGRSSAPASSAPAVVPSDGGGTPWSGPVSKGQQPVDGLLRETPDGWAFGFVLIDQNGKRIQVIALDEMAQALALVASDLFDREDPITVVDGDLEMVPWKKDGKEMRPYRRVIATRVSTPDFTVPAAGVAPSAPPATSDGKVDDLSDLPF